MHVLTTPDMAAHWLQARVTGALQTDSRKVLPGDGFIAWPGAVADGRQFVGQARDRGAVAALVELDGAQGMGLDRPDVAAYAGLKAATGPVAAAYYGQPSDAIDVLAVTGTNGKTSTAWWLSQVLSNLKQSAPVPCALIGTLGVGQAPAPGAGAEAGYGLEFTGLTTPDPVLLQRQLRRFVDAGFKACAVEASSIGIAERRLDGTRIRVAIFTNFTQDHLDYHADMGAYWEAKAELFRWPGLQACVVNVDDPQGARLAASLAGTGVDLWTTSCAGPARLQGGSIRYADGGLQFEVTEGGERQTVSTGLIGDYNAANLLGVLATLRIRGIALAEAAQACAALTPVPGRMECIARLGQPLVAVDYAHTPDALEKALTGLRPLAAQRGGRLWCLFGCGGNRDAGKRPMMAVAAEKFADRVVLTSDNPRDEDPRAILEQTLSGFRAVDQVHVQVDRAAAIRDAIAQASANDVVLLAGKGHETYQEISGVRHVFSDHDQALAALDARLVGHVDAQTPMMTLQQALAWIPGGRLVGDGSTPLLRVHTDTRTLQPGDLFVALRGEKFDANLFLADAAARGASAAIAHGGLAEAGLSGIEVDDTRAALGALATGWRAQFSLPLIGVTGSNGKTTITQMIASILKAWKPQDFLATQGNFNNDIGVPLTLLRLRAHHSLAVVEMGMNHPGEIEGLAGMARPTVALVNNAQREHQEFMSTVEAVARENGAVIVALPGNGVAVFPADDEYSRLWSDLAGQRAMLKFALTDPAASLADVSCMEPVWADGAWQVLASTPVGTLRYALRVAGRHNVRNSLAAIACTLAAGVPLQFIEKGLMSFEPVKGRSRAFTLHRAGREVEVVDDTYNANPDSVRAAIDVLAELPGPGLLVLGDMGEVGDQGPQFHAEVGAYATQRGIAHLLCLGPLSLASARAHATGRHFEEMEALIHAVHALLPEVRSVVVKGSRFMRMERVIEALSREVSPCC